MQCRTTTHTVVSIFVVTVHLIRVVEHSHGIIHADTVAKVAQARLDEESAVGIGTERKQFAHLALEKQTTLVDFQSGETTCAADDLTHICSDAFAENLDTVHIHLRAVDVVAIGSQKPIGLSFVHEAAAYIVTDTIQFLGVEARDMKSIRSLKHGHGDGVFHDVFCFLSQSIDGYADTKYYG